MSNSHKYTISHFVSFKKEKVSDNLVAKGELGMDQIKIGSFLKELRKEKDLTQGQLAEKINVSNRSVSRWETGSTLPDISILIELSEFYEVDIKEIINGERNTKDIKEEDIGEESEELMTQVVDYTSKDKEMILKEIKKYSGVASVALFVGYTLSAFDYANRFSFVTETLFYISLIFIISVYLVSSGKAMEMRKNNSKARKKLILLFAALLIATIALAFYALY